MKTPESKAPASKAKRVSPELAEFVSMLSALEQRPMLAVATPAKS